MKEQAFTQMCRELVAEYANKKLIEESKTDNIIPIKPEEVYVVWACKTLQNNKALLSTDIPDTRYYELTYNGNKHEIYFDAYVKEQNECIQVTINEN